MRIAMIGSGYVGLVSGACFAQFGHDVICIDKDADKIARLKRGEIPIYEPGLDRLVTENARAGRLEFNTNLADAVSGADAVFIAVGTPTRRGEGHADLTYVYAAAAEIAAALNHYTVVVTKSTVPVGTGREVERIIREARPEAEFDVASNPEFLREGAAIEDFMKPDRVVIGVESQRAREVMSHVYRPLNLIQTPMVFTNIETAEVTKYAGNAFLATKITFINEIADLCTMWRAVSALTAAAAASSSIPDRASAARASRRTRWRWSTRRARWGRRRPSSSRSSRSITRARSAWHRR
jgi:UDPglucose 6-dehydrogenase